MVPRDVEIWWITLENNRAPRLYHIKLCASFKILRWIQTGNAQLGLKSTIFCPPVTSIFNGWPWKAMGLIFSTTLRCVHHFKAMGEFKLELESWNAQFGSKSAICCPLWPCNLMDDLEKQRSTSSRSCKALCIISKPSRNSRWSYRPGRTDLGQNRRLF